MAQDLQDKVCKSKARRNCYYETMPLSTCGYWVNTRKYRVRAHKYWECTCLYWVYTCKSGEYTHKYGKLIREYTSEIASVLSTHSQVFSSCWIAPCKHQATDWWSLLYLLFKGSLLTNWQAVANFCQNDPIFQTPPKIDQLLAWKFEWYPSRCRLIFLALQQLMGSSTTCWK